MRAISTPGEQVLTFAPYFPEYGPYVAGTGAELAVVPPQMPDFQPNLEALEQMLCPRTACVLINTPNNPSGVVYSAQTTPEGLLGVFISAQAGAGAGRPAPAPRDWAESPAVLGYDGQFHTVQPHTALLREVGGEGEHLFPGV